MHNRIIGGAIDTEVKELTVNPCGEPFEARTVAIATPLAKSAHASRKASGWSGEGVLDKGLTLILS